MLTVLDRLLADPVIAGLPVHLHGPIRLIPAIDCGDAIDLLDHQPALFCPVALYRQPFFIFQGLFQIFGICLDGIIFFTGTPASRAVATPVKGGDAMELVYYIIMLYILLEILRTIKK